MTAATTDQRTGVADILQSTAEDGEIRCTLGYLYDGRGIGQAEPVWGVDGFVSRPNAQTADGAAMAFYLQGANHKYILATRDNRFADKVGTLDAGDRAIITDGEARVLVKKERDAVVLYTVNQKVDQSMMVDMGGVDGATKIINGKCFFAMTDDGINASITLGISGGSSMTLFEDGTVSINGAFFNCATPGGRLGVLSMTTPGPLAPLGSILMGPSGMTGLPSTSWTVTP